jgi:Transposase DDE domain
LTWSPNKEIASILCLSRAKKEAFVMLAPFLIFAKQILSFSGFQVSRIPRSVYQALLTAFKSLLNQEVVMIAPLIKLVKKLGPGRLIIDDTTNPKYGLKQWARKLKIVGTSGYEHGYKILLFLWENNAGRIPIGFALWHKDTKPLNELVIEGLSVLRNRFHLKFEVVLADGAFSTDKLFKRLENYGWACVMRLKNNRKLSNEAVFKKIKRGYGSCQGRLRNGAKVKAFRRKNRLYGCNRMTWEMAQIVKLYQKRWKVEDVFRALKVCLDLKGCQQHSMKAQTLYLLICLILFSGLELFSLKTDKFQSVYQTAQAVISQQINLQEVLQQTVFKRR